MSADRLLEEHLVCVESCAWQSKQQRGLLKVCIGGGREGHLSTGNHVRWLGREACQESRRGC